MTTTIAVAEVQRLMSAGAQIVDVLPEEEHLEAHIPGAIHLPLKQLTAETASRLDRDQPVVVYCWDSL